MTKRDPREARVSRESRLLLLTIVVCVVVLLVLARLRFPERPVVTALPLERLAAQASYDALAADIERVQALIAPNLVVLRVAPPLESAPRNIRDVLASPDRSSGLRHVAALRIGGGTAFASLDPGVRIDGIVGGATEEGAGATVVATDPVRRIARIRVPETATRQLPQLDLPALRAPVYVVAAEGTQAGVTLRPVFLGRGDLFATARWTQPLLPLGGVSVTPGALLFSLAGEFIGTVVVEEGATAIAGAHDVLETVGSLASAPRPAPSALGIAVQPLTPALATALSVHRGVVVSEVDPAGSAAGILEPADVITTLEGRPTEEPDDLLIQLASRPSGGSVSVSIARKGAVRTVALPLAATRPEGAEGGSVAFAREGGAGTHVVEGTEVAGTGLLPGDTVTHAGDIANPSPAQLRRMLAGVAPGGFAILTIRRDGRQRVLAVRTPDPDSAVRR
jgi:hypothetical protein